MKHQIIPVFIPHHGCPHQCVFCDQRAITGVARPPGGGDVAAAIDRHLALSKNPRPPEVAFYGGSFTALPADRQDELLAPAAAALAAGRIGAIRLSTRPDAVDGATVTRLLAHGVATVELGAQSLDDTVLAAAGRDHTAAATRAAVALLRAAGLAVGLQLMPGLPGEDWPSLIATTRQIVALRPAFIRIYPAVVLAGTPLAALHAAGAYRPLGLAAAVARAAYMKTECEHAAIPAIRVGLQAGGDLSAAIIAGPWHPAFGALVEAYIFRHMVARLLDSGHFSPADPLTVRHHPRDASALRGDKNANLRAWRRPVRLVPDWPLRGEIAVTCRDLTYLINKAMIFAT